MSQTPLHVLTAGLAELEASPKEASLLTRIVRRPGRDARERVSEVRVDAALGMIGDNWHERGGPGRPANPNMQLTLMNSRVIQLIAGCEDRWDLAGDQLYADLDLSVGNLPAGSRLRVGEAIIEVTGEPHLGCAKFRERFGADALAWVNSPLGRQLRLRGLNARVVCSGMIRVGDVVTRLSVA